MLTVGDAWGASVRTVAWASELLDRQFVLIYELVFFLGGDQTFEH